METLSHGFCNDLEQCGSTYGNDKLTFGTGTRLTVIPSKYFILDREMSMRKILGATIDHAGLEGEFLAVPSPNW